MAELDAEETHAGDGSDAGSTGGLYRVVGLGAQGDGLVRELDENGSLISGRAGIHVPFTLPGETVRLVTDAHAADGATGATVEIVEAHAARVDGVCPHFGTCGGCALQHVRDDFYTEWKSDLVRAAFAQRGLSPTFKPLISVGLGARRRVTLTAVGGAPGERPRVGFHASKSHDVIAITACPVADPAITQLLPQLTDLVETLSPPRGGLRVHVLVADNGICVDCEGFGRDLPATFRAKLADRAEAMRLVRFTIDGDPVALRGVPHVTFGLASVVPHPGAFLQAAKLAETVMSDAVVAALPKRAKRAADLFCGLGALTFPLAEMVGVFASDNAPDALDALKAAQRDTQGLKKIDVLRRDLIQDPLSRKELEPFELVVFDPPRSGAKEQAEALAKSKVPVVVAVSCNPATLARDVRILVDGGYEIESVQPIDQFVFSPHVEAVVVLKRPLRR
ncbi:MAG: class I SAM-dependent RNA methyltransferase [Pseudomonadota bacterium]